MKELAAWGAWGGVVAYYWLMVNLALAAQKMLCSMTISLGGMALLALYIWTGPEADG